MQELRPDRRAGGGGGALWPGAGVRKTMGMKSMDHICPLPSYFLCMSIQWVLYLAVWIVLQHMEHIIILYLGIADLTL